ncbi:SH2 domain-containing adapter protein D, partial [Frankliniella fusca]
SVCINWTKRAENRLGGPGKVVEADETYFGKIKSNIGRPPTFQQWVWGAVEKHSTKCILVPVEKRDAETLIPLCI